MNSMYTDILSAKTYLALRTVARFNMVSNRPTYAGYPITDPVLIEHIRKLMSQHLQEIKFLQVVAENLAPQKTFEVRQSADHALRVHVLNKTKPKHLNYSGLDKDDNGWFYINKRGSSTRIYEEDLVQHLDRLAEALNWDWIVH